MFYENKHFSFGKVALGIRIALYRVVILIFILLGLFGKTTLLSLSLLLEKYYKPLPENYLEVKVTLKVLKISKIK